MGQPSKAELTYEPELTGLLIVDPYNDFLSEGGKLYELSRSTLEANNVVEHMRQVLAAARANGVQVFIAPHHRWRERDPYSRWKTMPPVQASAAKGHTFADGTGVEVFTPISSRIPTRSSLRSIGSQVDSPTRTSTSSSRSTASALSL
jgi:ureidoacrylate peracid hydrolase